MDLAQLAKQVGELIGKIEGFEKHFENHLSNHKWDRIFIGIQTIIIIGLFCFLKWH